MRPMATRNRRHDDFSRQKLFAAAVILLTLWVTVSAWDEKDLAERHRAFEDRKENAARWLVEQTGQTGFYDAVKHCRVPGKGERLVMQLAGPDEPGNGYRCAYWMRGTRGLVMGAEVEYSRSPDVKLVGRVRMP